MARQKDNEKMFAEYMDRILTGGEIIIDPSLDGEMRADLEFVKKACALGQAPTAQFQARLKARLIEKLETQQVRKQEQGFKIFNALRQPVWKAAIAVVLVILAVTIVWQEGVFQHNENLAPTTPASTTTSPNQSAAPATTTATTAAPTTTKAPSTTNAGVSGKPVVSIDAKTDKTTYRAGEMVSISISMKNVSGQPLNLTDFPPIMSLVQADTKQPVYTFHAGTAAMTLAPNQAAAYTYTWNETNFSGQQVSGSYYVELEDLEYNGQPYKLNLNSPVNFTILY